MPKGVYAGNDGGLTGENGDAIRAKGLERRKRKLLAKHMLNTVEVALPGSVPHETMKSKEKHARIEHAIAHVEKCVDEVMHFLKRDILAGLSVQDAYEQNHKLTPIDLEIWKGARLTAFKFLDKTVPDVTTSVGQTQQTPVSITINAPLRRLATEPVIETLPGEKAIANGHDPDPV